MRINDIESSGSAIITDSSNLSLVEKKLDEFAYNNNLVAEILDLEKQTIYSSGSNGMNGQMGMMRNVKVTEAYDKVMKGESVSLKMTQPRFGSEFMLIGLPIIGSGKVQAALIITLPLAPMDDTVNILKQQLIYITAILLLATLLLTYILSRSFTQPILDITKVSMDMASGNLTSRIKTNRKDEIGRLGEAINHMGTELSKVEQLRKDLLANVSHELRTPLSLIKGYGETIRDISGDSPEKREKQIGIIIEEADRLGGIVEDMLRLSQMEAGYADLNMEKFRLDETLNRVLKKYELFSERTGVTIIQHDFTKTFVNGDSNKIEQVLYNLINNAFNHSPNGGIIKVETLDKKDRIRIEISDVGEGIPEDEINYIWDRFYKVDKSGKREQAGTGLGLAIVKNILIAHEAIFGVESEKGKGTTFWFELKKTE